jgi:glutathione peroxidase
MRFPGRSLLMRGVLLSLPAVMLLAAGLWAKSTFLAPTVEFAMPVGTGSLYDLKAATLAGQPADLAAYRGKVVLVVNVASQCGYTPQYAGLEKLYRELEPRGFAVLGFPSNDFGGQEPGSPEEITQFCKTRYDVTFPMFAKVVTRPGPDQSPVYAFLGESGSLPQWNFSKYVVDKNGKVTAFFPSRVAPDAPELRADIEKALAAPAR